MTVDEINDIINGESNEVDQAFKEIIKLQKREVAPIKTGIPDLDHFLLTGLNNMMVFVGARPSMGKTHTASVIKENLLNPQINPNLDIALLNLNWEMQMKSSILRYLKRSTGRNMRDILSREFSEKEKEELGYIMAPMYDERVLNFNHVIEGGAFEHLVHQFVKKNEGKEVVILVDHIHILLTKQQIDEFLFTCNKLKIMYTNLSFVIFFQLRRDIEQRWRGGADAKVKLNPKNFVPNSGDIYNTDMLFQFADVIMTQVIPQVVDLDEYTTVNKDRNKHLESHFIAGSSSDNKSAKLKGRNRIFRNYIKIRLNDNFEDPRMYCDILDPEKEEMVHERYYSNVKVVNTKPSFIEEKQIEPPVVDLAFQTLNNSSAKGEGFDDTPPNKKTGDKPPFV
jgi:hypothetical protein